MKKKVRYERIIIEAKKYISVPFCHFGRSTLGLDCAGLPWIAHHRNNLDVLKLDYEYGPRWWRDSAQGERLLEGYKKSGFYLTEKPVVGGLVLFRLYTKKAPINHSGILINKEQFIHAKSGIGRKINKVSIDYIEPGYIKRVAGYMIHKDVDYGRDVRRTNSR